MKKNFDRNADYQPSSFTFNDKKAVEEIIARYPIGRQKSAVMPLLDLAQRQVGIEGAKSSSPYGGWIPAKAIEEIAKIIGESEIDVLEVAMFYSMYNMEPVGVNLVQICTMTPCWLSESDEIVDCCKKELGIEIGETTKDGLFTLLEVECLGACSNAPVVQINDDYFEDLDYESMKKIIEDLREGKTPKTGSQKNRCCSSASKCDC